MTTVVQETIGERIELLRCRRGLSRQTLASVVGHSSEWLRQVERKGRQVDRLSTLLRLADVLQVKEVAAFMGGRRAGPAGRRADDRSGAGHTGGAPRPPRGGPRGWPPAERHRPVGLRGDRGMDVLAAVRAALVRRANEPAGTAGTGLRTAHRPCGPRSTPTERRKHIGWPPPICTVRGTCPWRCWRRTGRWPKPGWPRRH
ncbi:MULTISPECIES: helix-turn-helix domain-containing protein [unclassified Streptomyces]|uniref:helix-turn-helix domain-containing protein n=1 Tax=unclassified Streptomyces TaxID=2593676 RepID=UPI0035DD1F05